MISLRDEAEKWAVKIHTRILSWGYRRIAKCRDWWRSSLGKAAYVISYICGRTWRGAMTSSLVS